MSSSPTLRWISAVALALTGACGDDTSATVDMDATGTTGQAFPPSTGEAMEPSTTSEEPEPVPAQGIRLDRIEANQGVAIPIMLDGETVGPAERIAPLVAHRRTLVRAFWALDDDWEPREIEARLHLHRPGEDTEVLVQTKLVQGPTQSGNLDHVFYWGIEAEDVPHGLRYHLDLWEVPGHEAGDAAAPNRYPHEGTAQVGIEQHTMVLDVLIVPFVYDDGNGCSTAPDVSEETLQSFEDQLYMLNPVQSIEMRVREPVHWNEELESFAELNAYMSNLRFADGASPQTYYYGVIDPCKPTLQGFGGMAHGIPSDPTSVDAAWQRVSSGLSGSAYLFVHEVGHSQGRHHIACSGEELWPDLTYPHELGAVNEWGFGVLDLGLKHPTAHKDYMTYCHPFWVGAWGWNKTYPVIRVLSTWGADASFDPSDPYRGSLLVGLILPSGQERWSTVPGSIGLREADDETRIELTVGESIVAVRPTRVAELPDGAGERMVVAELPPEFEAATSVVRVTSSGRRLPIDREAIDIGHHRRRVASRPRAP